MSPLPRNPRLRCMCLAAALLVASTVCSTDAAEVIDLSHTDLTGHWYVLVHYKDDRSEDKSITKFKDLAWSIEQGASKLELRHFPYVFFSEADELKRRYSMTEHVAWEPEARVWREIREKGLRTSHRAAKKKTLRGSIDKGFRTGGGGGGGLRTLTFSQDWSFKFASDGIVIEVEDSLSGGMGLETMDEKIVYRLTERVAPDEFRGRYDDATKHGTFRMVRAKENLAERGPPEPPTEE